MNLLDGTLEQAVEALAVRATELSLRPPTYQEKRAAGLSDVLGGLGSAAQNNPSLASALLGGAVGAGAGGIHTALGNRGKDESEQRGYLGSMLTGGLAGAAVGGGLGMAHKGLQGLKAEPSTAHSDLLALHQKLKELNAPAPLTDRGIGYAAGAAGDIASRFVPGLNPLLRSQGVLPDLGPFDPNRYAPITSNVMPALGSLDMLLHSGANTGERFGWGKISPEMSRNPSYLHAGVSGKDLKLQPGIQDALLHNVSNQPGEVGSGGMGPPTPPGDIHVPGSRPGDARSVTNILGSSTGNPGGIKNWFKRLVGSGGKGDSGDRMLEIARPDPGANAPSFLAGTPPPPEPPHALSRLEMQSAKRHGWAAVEKDLGHTEPHGLFRGLLGERHPASLKARVGGRVAGYGLPMVGEFLLRSLMEDNDKKRQIQELTSQFAKSPLPGGK